MPQTQVRVSQRGSTHTVTLEAYSGSSIFQNQGQETGQGGTDMGVGVFSREGSTAHRRTMAPWPLPPSWRPQNPRHECCTWWQRAL